VPGCAFESPLETSLRNAGDARGLLDGIGDGEVAAEPALRFVNCGVAMTDYGLEDAAFGAQAGKARLATVFKKAGFRELGKAKAISFNLILKAKV